MREYIDVTGKNEDEAISKALSQLGMERDSVSVEVLERAKSGFLGFGSCPAKVRVYYGPEEEESLSDLLTPEPVKPAPAPKPVPPAPKPEAVKSAPAPETKPVKPAPTPETVNPAPKPEAAEERKEPVRREERRSGRDRRSRREPRAEAAQRPESAPEKDAAAEKPAPVPALGEEVDDEKAQAIKKFLSGLLEHMGNAAEIKVYLPEKGRYKVILEGQGLGALIGRRGETLDAIQQLTSYAVNRSGVRVRVQLDAENYRAKREQSLQHLARKVAAKVIRYRRSVTLEPMNAYERHVIHTALQDFEGVTTHSTGVDPNRRVVVSLDREKR